VQLLQTPLTLDASRSAANVRHEGDAVCWGVVA
jgi:hypothetical protein